MVRVMTALGSSVASGVSRISGAAVGGSRVGIAAPATEQPISAMATNAKTE